MADGLEKHLTWNGMGDWLPTLRALRPYLRRDGAAWGEYGVINSRRWRDDVQYQAVRRLLTQRLGINQRSLRRRFDERDWWGRGIMSLIIELETTGPLLALDLFGKTTPGASTVIPGPAILTIQQMREQRALDVPTLLTMALEFGKDVGIGLVSAWLYDKLKGRARAVRINRIEVQLDKGKIEKVIAEQIERRPD